MSRNPTTGKVHDSFPETTDAVIDARLAGADRVYRETLLHPLADVVAARGRMLRHAATVLETGAEEYARIMTREMGKTLASAKAEVLKCARTCRYYAEHGPAMLKPEPAKLSSGAPAEVRHEPIGVVLAVMPWNFPFWQVFRCAAPILLSGNSMVLKHASNVPECALAIEAIFHEAFKREHLDPAAFATFLIPSSRVEKIIADRRIRGVTLTGSEGAGRKVAAAAGANLKKSVLELGGSDPFVVFPTANLERAVLTAVESRLLANGQSCIAAKRFLVHESIYDSFKEGMLTLFRRVKMGDPTATETGLGPLAGAKNREDLHALVQDARAKGATVCLGGEIPKGDGFFYPPTVVENIPPSAHLYREEAFGPLASLYKFQTHDQMIATANATPYGLGASIWTKEDHEIDLCARRLESGQLFVNGLVASDPGVPFGGVKDSGYGRELGTYGVREWTIPKTLVRA
ncbi:MAG: NAD-dependent succinate-semialdehyde dehydrogenase [Bdellovibrionales bacterium]|nr:NAD-dependent succinate-semialdehyde dehydrogenase [Bdellovibrionales bacterium]